MRGKNTQRFGHPFGPCRSQATKRSNGNEFHASDRAIGLADACAAPKLHGARGLHTRFSALDGTTRECHSVVARLSRGCRACVEVRRWAIACGRDVGGRGGGLWGPRKNKQENGWKRRD